MKKTISAPDAARKLGFSRQRLSNLLLAGRIPGAYRLGTGPRAPWIIPGTITRAALGLPRTKPE